MSHLINIKILHSISFIVVIISLLGCFDSKTPNDTLSNAKKTEIIKEASQKELSRQNDTLTETPETGIIHIKKLPPSEEFATRAKGSSDIHYDDGIEARKKREKKKYAFTIQFDTLEKIIIDQNNSLVFNKLSLKERHLVKIFEEGKIYQSFWFSFKDKNTDDLQLWYDPFYDTWRLTPLN